MKYRFLEFINDWLCLLTVLKCKMNKNTNLATKLQKIVRNYRQENRVNANSALNYEVNWNPCAVFLF